MEGTKATTECKIIVINIQSSTSPYIHEHRPDVVHASLVDAMETMGIAWEGIPHTSIADTIACQKVWDALFPHYYQGE